MRHQVKGKKLGRNTKQRKALFKSLISHLIIKGEIITTLAKAKAIQRLTDKLITRAKKTNLNSRRIVAAFFNQKHVTNKLVDELAPQMSNRQSGYTKITRLGPRRGDSSMMVKLEFTDRIITKEKSANTSKKTKPSTDKRSKTKQPTSSQPSLAQQAINRLKSGSQFQAATKVTAPRTTNK